MAISLSNQFSGLSTDAKPAAASYTDYLFYEVDTGRMFRSDGVAWGISADSKEIPGVPIYCCDDPLVIASGNLLTVDSLVWTDSEYWGDVPFTDYSPEADIVFYPAATTMFDSDPLVIASGLAGIIGGDPATLVWLNADRCPRTISTLLVIGV